MKIRLDINDLTLGEIEEFEELTGTTVGSIKEGSFTAKQMRAAVWLALRKDNPEMTFDDTKDLTLRELNISVVPPAGAGPAATANGSRPSARSSAGARRTRSGV